MKQKILKYCFCQILNANNENPINGDINNKENIKIFNTDFFFVGGFDEDKGLGMIKLFKIKYNKIFKNTSIEYIEDIIIEENDEFNGFEGPISCITQSNMFGNIIITCWDGNIYIFKPPNIDYFLPFHK